MGKKANRPRKSSVKNHVVAAIDNGKVPLQSEPFTGKYSRYVISPELASERFKDVIPLLGALNKTFGTNISVSYPGVQMTLGYLISKGHDFGAIYARMQTMWPTLSMPSKSSKTFHHPPKLTSKICRDVKELLTLLNETFMTKITIDYPDVKEVLECLMVQRCKFGDICTIVGDAWPRTPFIMSTRSLEWGRAWREAGKQMNLWEDFLIIEDRGEAYERSRQESLRDNNTIVKPHLIKPRRIWDLYAHRVIPFQFGLIDPIPQRLWGRFRPTNGIYRPTHSKYNSEGCKRYHAVSHSWTEDMSGVDSPVNGREWLVPLPRGVTLEAVRNELLNLGAQYVWLDVVCLRQETPQETPYPDLEALRTQEWKIDLPTIGWVYMSTEYDTNVIRYFNGLGKAFKGRGWWDETHWSQRAWTVQEIGTKNINAGVPEGVVDLLEETDENGTKLRDHLKKCEMRGEARKLHKAVSVMKGRYSKEPVDKVLGLSALLRCVPQIAYLKGEAPEEAWARFVKHSGCSVITELLMCCSLPGENGCYWRPSWRQLMDGTRVVEERHKRYFESSVAVDEGGRYTHKLDKNGSYYPPHSRRQWEDAKKKRKGCLGKDLEGVTVGKGGCLSCTMVVIGSCQVSTDSVDTVRIKTTRVHSGDSFPFKWTMSKPHAQDIAPGQYTLAAIDSSDSTWVLCSERLGRFEKVCIFEERGREEDFRKLQGRWSSKKKVVFC